MHAYKSACLAGVLAFGVSVFFGSAAIMAGPGHDHGHGAAPAAAGPMSPRVTAQSEAYEFVGILSDGRLVVYLDRRTDTSPVTDAVVTLTVDGKSGVAKPQADGSYVFSSPVLSQTGEREVIISIAGGEKSDLLVGALKGGDAHGHLEAAENEFGHDHASHHPVGSGAGGMVGRLAGWIANPLVAAVLALLIGLLIGLWVRPLRAAAGALVFVLATLVNSGDVKAGPGHDHGIGNSRPGQNSDAPHRLPDGTMFLPKPTQRLLEIRTRILQPETAHGTRTLIGRVISDPNRSGLVQSTVGGRLKVAGERLPVLGQVVKAGEILALVEPAFEPIDASDVGQTAGDLDQKIGVIKARIEQRETLVRKGIYNGSQLKVFKAELQGLLSRKRQLQKSSVQVEALVAPIDGVVAHSHVVAGQVVERAKTLFRLVDPSSMWIEAIAFDPNIALQAVNAQARTGEGDVLQLDFVGRSRALQQQATVLQFRIKSPPDTLNIGAPVRVEVASGDAIEGLIVPRAAIAQAPNGQDVAFKRIAPESYRPSPVRIERLDAERVRIISGVAAGDQIIVRNASLVNQIR